MFNQTACFTGHRPQKLPWGFNEEDERCLMMKSRTKVEIENAIRKGYKTFLCGMALGFDMICAEIVLELKNKYSNITLIGALPCKNQSERWTKSQQERHNNLIKRLDGIRCVHEKYTDDCMQERNRFMIDNSSLIIALRPTKNGGAKSTIDYAKALNKKVVEIEV